MRKNNMTKTLLLLVIALGINVSALVAQVKIGDNPETINESSVLELESTTQGLLLSRMTTAQRDAIVQPSTGLMIFNLTTNCLELNYGTPAAPNWGCMGVGTTPDVPPTNTVPANVTLGEKTYTVASVYDQDYLPYTAPTTAATTATVNADGANESVTVDVQGTITTAGVTIKIPCTATTAVTLPAYSATRNVEANLTQDGIARDLQLIWGDIRVASGQTYIEATLKSLVGILNVKKLDINAGIGDDSKGILLATFTYNSDNAGNTKTLEVRAISAIPDREFGDGVHDFVYVPIQAEDGNIWLNNNLGADYANVHHASFNPVQQATSATDYHAYGSLYQWGRGSDGHELINRTSNIATTAVNGTTSTLATSDTPNNAKFITTSSSPDDWRSPQNDALWQGVGGANNTCPSGYRVPTEAEWVNYISSGIANITNSASAASSDLRLSVAGVRVHGSGEFGNLGGSGMYWSSTKFGTNIRFLGIGSSHAHKNSYPRAHGCTVRCLKD